MDVQELDQFSRLAEANNSTVWSDMIGRYEISFTDHYISLIQSKNHEILLDSEHCKVLLFNDLNCIVSIGGFQAHNDGKYLAEKRCLPLVTIPTQLANDSFGTNRYSITDDEQSASIETVFPVKTIFDIPYLQANGIEKSLWGIGEFIGLYFSIIDYSMKHHLDFDGLLSWIVEQTHELNSLYENGCDDRIILKRIAILLTIKCLVMRTNGNHEIGCGIDHSFARCFEKNTQLPHGKSVFLGSLLAIVLFPEWHNYGLSMSMLLKLGKMMGITAKEIQYLQSLDLHALIRLAIQVRPKRSQSLESIIGKQSYRIDRANEQIQRLVWED
jgi:glycerol-1-phosphate dehydrogenase [NAD(P)+]